MICVPFPLDLYTILHTVLLPSPTTSNTLPSCFCALVLRSLQYRTWTHVLTASSLSAAFTTTTHPSDIGLDLPGLHLIIDAGSSHLTALLVSTIQTQFQLIPSGTGCRGIRSDSNRIHYRRRTESLGPIVTSTPQPPQANIASPRSFTHGTFTNYLSLIHAKNAWLEQPDRQQREHCAILPADTDHSVDTASGFT